MNDAHMNSDGPFRGPSGENSNIAWFIDRKRNYLRIELIGMVSDRDLLHEIPAIWTFDPDVYLYDVVVDARITGGSSNWTWSAMAELGDLWCAYAKGKKISKRCAIVTENFWITQLVNNAFGLVFPGNRFKCFETPEAAENWSLKGIG